jgi:hypothetical protein
MEDLYDYVEQFPLMTLSEDQEKKVSQRAKDLMTQAVKNLNDWIAYWSKQMDEQGTLSEMEHQLMVLQYEAICNGANIANSYALIDLYDWSVSDPVNNQPDLITEEDVIDSDLTDAQKYVNELRASVESALNKLQELIQSYQSTDALDLTEDGIAEIMQFISNLDAIFNSDEVAEGLIDIDPSYYRWYYGENNDGARAKALSLIPARPEELPEPIIPVPSITPVPPTIP